MAEIAVSVAIELIEKAIGVLSDEVKHTFGNVEDIKTSLTIMQACLQDAERVEGGEVMKNLTKRIQNIALEIEDVLDEFMMHAPRHNFNNQFLQTMYMVGHNIEHWYPLHEIQSKMQAIKERIEKLEASQVFREFLRRHSFRLESYDNGTSSRHHQALTPEILPDDEILGMEETKRKLVHQLINNPQMIRRTVAVVGQAGSGKTVLINNVYRSKRIQGQFECCAWINVPPTVNGDFSQSLVASFQMGIDEREITLSELQKILRRKKYVVVVDDIRSEQQWICIERALPNEPNGSRIIVTTINTQVAADCAGLTDHIHQINELPWNYSWSLFCQKAFKTSNGKCPSDLVDIAEKIVTRCEGTPLAIASVGSLLSRKRFLPAEWKKVHDNLGPEIETSSRNETISNMLNRSYKDLPSHLKSCFLYFSIFPEDYAVGRARLIRLWVAEGFVKKTGRKNLEETAEDYLNELVDRHLIQACSRDFDGRVRSCRVLDLVREFAIMKSEEENFAAILTESCDVNALENIRRLSIYNFQLERIRGRAKLNHLRTLSAFRFSKDVSSDVKAMTDECKLLRVLDLQNAPMQQFPGSIAAVPLLRYLCLRGTNVKVVPKSINELHYLEYLDLKYTNITVLPKDVCKLHNLRHLLVYRDNAKNSISFNNIIGTDVLGNIGDMPNLQNLTLVKARGKKFLIELGNLKQLQKLGLIELRKEDGKNLCESIKEMKNLSVLSLMSASEEEELDFDYMDEFPSNLQRLYLNGRLRTLPRWINQSLSSVVRIQLKWSRLTDSPIEALRALPNLIELQMVEAFTGGVLIFEEGDFKKMKTLHIERFNYLDTMAVYDGAMPQLQKLTVVHCKNLKTLPSGIENLKSLEKLLVYDMLPEFTSRLEKGSEDRKMINHIAVIRSFNTDANGTLYSSNYS